MGQEIQTKLQHLRLFEKRDKFYVQNKIFETEILQRKYKAEQALLEREICIIWNVIWGAEKCHSGNAKWLKVSKNNMRSIQKQQWQYMTAKETKHLIIKSDEGKQQKMDKIPSFQLDAFSSIHATIVTVVI